MGRCRAQVAVGVAGQVLEKGSGQRARLVPDPEQVTRRRPRTGTTGESNPAADGCPDHAGPLGHGKHMAFYSE